MRVHVRRSALLPATLMVVAFAGCTRGPAVPAPAVVPVFTVHHMHAGSRPSPFLEVRSGNVQAIVPDTWKAQPLAGDRYPQQGFVAAPSLPEWERSAGAVRGMEVFWVDIGKVEIPSDYYYLLARTAVLTSLATNKSCRLLTQRVFVDHPPDLTGRRFSPSDYVASVSGTCRMKGRATRWAYVVAAPGFGPVRDVGIPSSGLYVVMAVVSGPRSKALLEKIIDGAQFGNTTIPQMVKAATTAQ